MKLFSNKAWVAAWGMWGAMVLARFWHVGSYAGLSFDDVAYATSGKDLLLEGHGYWADTLRPFMTWLVAFLHWLFGVSIRNVGIAFAFARCAGDFFIILAARRFFKNSTYAPVCVMALSAASFLGASYGKQHLASLLCTVPFSLWCYGRYLDSGRVRDWVFCSMSAGLVFLSHYNTIAALGIMLGGELIRLGLARESWRRLLWIALVGLAGCFVVVAALGKASYGYANWISYIRLVYAHMMVSQTHGPPGWSDGFLAAFLAWEGVAFVIYGSAIIWCCQQFLQQTDRRTLMPLVGVVVIGGGLVLLRVNLGYLSVPRLYVFCLPFLWLLGGGFWAEIVARFLKAEAKGFGKLVVGGGLLLTLLVGISHQTMFRFYSSAYLSMEQYFQSHPTNKMVAWEGNPHLAAFWFDRRYCRVVETKEAAERVWMEMNKLKGFNKNAPAALLKMDRMVFLKSDRLRENCDLIVLECLTIATLVKYDKIIKAQVPAAKAVDFYSGYQLSLPVVADEGGGLASSPDFSEGSRLPFIRIYDLRG